MKLKNGIISISTTFTAIFSLTSNAAFVAVLPSAGAIDQSKTQGYDYISGLNSGDGSEEIVDKGPCIEKTELQRMIYDREDITDVNTSCITDFSYITYYNSRYATSITGDVSGWDVSNGTNFENMFITLSDFNDDISGWDVSNGTNFKGMFYQAISFNQDISGWNVSKGTNFNNMFEAAQSFNQAIGRWDVSNGQTFNGMLDGTLSFNQDISNWNMSNATDLGNMFFGSIFNQDISSWDVSNVSNFAGMFYSAQQFSQDISGWNVDNATEYSYFYTNSGLTSDQVPEKFR